MDEMLSAQYDRLETRFVECANTPGSITGYTIDSDDVTRTFVRLASGEIVEICGAERGRGRL